MDDWPLVTFCWVDGLGSLTYAVLCHCHSQGVDGALALSAGGPEQPACRVLMGTSGASTTSRCDHSSKPEQVNTSQSKVGTWYATRGAWGARFMTA